jgi:hypothetical protein
MSPVAIGSHSMAKPATNLPDGSVFQVFCAPRLRYYYSALAKQSSTGGTMHPTLDIYAHRGRTILTHVLMAEL